MLHLLSIPPSAAPQLCERVLLSEGTGACCPRPPLPSPSTMKRLTITFAVLLAAAVAAPTADASSKQLLIMQDDIQLRTAPGRDAGRVRRPRRRRGQGQALLGRGRSARPAQAERLRRRRIPPTTPGAATTPRSGRSSPRACGPTSLGGHAPRWATRGRGRTADDAAERQGVPQVRRGRRRALPGRRHLVDLERAQPLLAGSARSAARGTPLSPSIYRNLYLAGHHGLSGAGHRGDTILLGELMPRGGDVSAQGAAARVPARDGLPRQPLPPDPRHAPPSSAAAARSARIPTSGHRLPPLHAAAAARTCPAQGRRRRSASSARLRSTIDALRAARQAAPPPADLDHRVRLPDQAARPVPGRVARGPPASWTRASGSAFRNSRVESYSQYTLFDDPPRPGSGPLRWSSWQAGLHFLDGRRKPGVYDAFRLPFFVRTLSANRVEVFGARRTLTGGTAQIESKAAGASYRPLGSVSGQLDRLLPPRLQGQRGRAPKVQGHARRHLAREAAGRPLVRPHLETPKENQFQ